jgi:hypothetical protein
MLEDFRPPRFTTDYYPSIPPLRLTLSLHFLRKYCRRHCRCPDLKEKGSPESTSQMTTVETYESQLDEISSGFEKCIEREVTQPGAESSCDNGAGASNSRSLPCRYCGRDSSG